VRAEDLAREAVDACDGEVGAAIELLENAREKVAAGGYR